jgi:hypothetical protein
MVVELIVATSRAERLVVLLPALVVGLGLVSGVLILLGRAFADSVRAWGHPRLLAAGLVALLGVVALLTWLGVSLPKE